MSEFAGYGQYSIENQRFFHKNKLKTKEISSEVVKKQKSSGG